MQQVKWDNSAWVEASYDTINERWLNQNILKYFKFIGYSLILRKISILIELFYFGIKLRHRSNFNLNYFKLDKYSIFIKCQHETNLNPNQTSTQMKLECGLSFKAD